MTQKKTVVYTTILREDRDWINATKGKLNRAQRLHQIILAARTPVPAEEVKP